MTNMLLLTIFLVFLFGNVNSLLLDNNAQSALQHDVDELKQTVAVLKQEVEKLKHPTVVAFLAELGGSYFTPTVGQHLIYSNVHLNTGNGYHKFHGTFIAPVSGIYYINVAATVSEATSKTMKIKIKKNGTEVGYIFFDLLQAQWLKNRDAIIIHLTAGDEVWTEVVGISGGSQIATNYMHTYFSGFLINQDSLS